MKCTDPPWGEKSCTTSISLRLNGSVWVFQGLDDKSNYRSIRYTAEEKAGMSKEATCKTDTFGRKEGCGERKSSMGSPNGRVALRQFFPG
jgi:hypothetical protein